VAERIAASGAGAVTYVATGPVADPGVDPGWAARVSEHRARRPPAWTTLEVPAAGDLGALIAAIEGVVIVDSLGTWVAGRPEVTGGPGPSGAADAATAADAALVEALRDRRADGRASVVVSEEVGLGVHPSTAVGGRFRDALGRLNRMVADAADAVLLVVAGRVLALPAPGELPAPDGARR
jgi:adenosylcobinamide kinase/adenosylcobinamide-phosphate guanylyltransferase